MMIETRHTVCRIYHAACDFVVTIEKGAIRSIHGDKNNPAYHGYSCIKGRASGALLSAPSRLLSSLERQPDGSHRAVDAGHAVTGIALRLRTIIATSR